ncbi:MAG: alpha/beta hydrolase [Ignisphaera sp.]
MPMICFEKPTTFPSAGYELSAHVHIPPQGPKNMVLMLHGFTGFKSEVNRLFIDIARALCKNGVAVFRFDYRGHGDSP